MSREQLLELEDMKRGLLVQAYRMKQECPHMSPVGLEHEMYVAIMAEILQPEYKGLQKHSGTKK